MGDASRQVTRQTSQTSQPIVVKRQASRQGGQGVAPAPQLNQAASQFKSPIMQHAITLTDESHILIPQLNDLVEAYDATEMTLVSSQNKRNSLLEKSKERYNQQKLFFRKVNQLKANGWRRSGARDIPIDKAMKLTDAEIIAHIGDYKGPKEYLTLRYKLISNKYFALLPEREMREIPRPQLIYKLRQLYAKSPDQRNGDLIDFYQNLVRLYDFKEAEEQKKRRASDRSPVRSAEEIKKDKRKNKDALKQNSAILDKSYYSQTDKAKRKDVMQKVLDPQNNEEFLQESKLEISDAQQEGLRDVFAWMYRNCNKSSESKEPFIYKLTKQEPEKLLLMFYLVEKNIQAPSGSTFYDAVNEYVPNVTLVKEQLIASKLKFWKRIGKDSSDDVINWSRLGEASRFAFENEDLENYVKYSTEIKTKERDFEALPANELKQRRDARVSVMEQKANLLLSLYRSSGISPDMPVDMIANVKIREKANALVQEISEEIRLLDSMTVALPREQQNSRNPRFDLRNSDREAGEAPNGGEEDEGDPNLVDDLSVGAGMPLALDDTLVSLGNSTKNFTDISGYVVGTSAFTAANGILSIISAVNGIREIIGGASTLSLADHVSKALSVSGDLMGGVGDTVQGTANILGQMVQLGGEAEEAAAEAGWLGTTTVRSASEAFSTVAGGIEFTTGALVAVGGLVKAVGGGIQIGRSVSSHKDIKRSQEKLDSKNEADLTDDEKLLRSFLAHQKNDVKDKTIQGTVQTVSGTLMMAGGILTMTGILAPLGGILALAGAITDIGFGLIYARKRRRLTRQLAVDSSLKLDSIIETVKNGTSDPSIVQMKDDELKKLIRQEALAELGYATSKECFADLMKKNAEMLYRNVFIESHTEGDKKMYEDALKSVGLKIKRPVNTGDKPIPSIDVIYAKLME